MISAGGGLEAAVNARIRSNWRKFRELLYPLLTSRGTPLQLKGKLYAACVTSMILYGSETWVIKKRLNGGVSEMNENGEMDVYVM